MAMPELGADHVTLGMPILSDLASYSALPAHKKGTWKKSVKDFDGIDEPHFIWSNWDPPKSAEKGKRMNEIAKSDPLSKVMTNDQKLASTDVDYLEGDVLDKLNEEDEVTRLRLAEALKRFSLMEDESQKFIEELQQRV
jgi:transaldolase